MQFYPDKTALNPIFSNHKTQNLQKHSNQTYHVIRPKPNHCRWLCYTIISQDSKKANISSLN